MGIGGYDVSYGGSGEGGHVYKFRGYRKVEGGEECGSFNNGVEG